MTDDTLDEARIKALEAQISQLPREIEPPADSWKVIAAAIAASTEGTESAGEAERSAMRTTIRFWQRPAFLLAAALTLVAGSSVITAVALGRRGIPDAPEIAARGVSPQPSATPATLAEFTVVENEYISTANRLSAMLESEDTQLTPETIAKLKESLRIIDAAILEARRALAADPANKELVEMLSTSYNHKLDLLRRTTEMGRS